MFLRFSKGMFKGQRTYRKAVLLGDDVVMEYGNDIIGIATKIDETPKCVVHKLWVATQNELCATKIARSIKDLIGRSNKFTDEPTSKRRKYIVEQVPCAVLPIRVGIAVNDLPNI